MRKSQPLLAASTLSDHRIKRVIHCYANGLPAREAARRLRLSYPTVRRIYDLIRKRMFEICAYRTVSAYLDLQNDMERDGFPYQTKVRR